MNDQQPSLVRGLGLWDAGSVVVGCVIGAGIFRLSDSVAQASPSPFVFFAAWVVAGFLSLCGALTYAELASRFPQTGGDYVFLTEAYGRLWGFVFGWTKVFVQRVGTLAILSYVFAEHAVRFTGWQGGWVRPLATGAIVLLCAANTAGLSYGKTVQNVFTALKVGALLLIVGAGAGAQGGSLQNFTPFFPSAWGFDVFSAIGVGMIFALWTYGGWENAAYVAGEVRDPARNVPRAIVRGLSVTIVLYLAVNAVYLYYLPLETMGRTDLVAAGTLERIWPLSGGRLMALMVMGSTFGALNGFLLATSRILLALSADHVLFRPLAAVHPRLKTPAVSLAVNAALALILIWTGTLDKIVTYSEIVIYLFFAATGMSLFVFRRRLGGQTPSRVWGYPVTPMIFVGMCLAFAGNALWQQPREAFLGLGVALLGVPLYFFSERLRKRGV